MAPQALGQTGRHQYCSLPSKKEGASGPLLIGRLTVNRLDA